MIAWPVCEDDCRSADAEAFARTARQGALTWLRDMGEAVRSTLGSGILSLALYVPSEQDEFILERVDGSSAVAPDQLRLSDARSVARASWWGEITVIEKTAADRSEFRGDEMLVAFIPIRGEESVGQEALGLLRLGVGSDSAGVRSLDQKKRQVFQQMLATEASVVLKAFRNAHGGER
jgi:hypothetical protein